MNRLARARLGMTTRIKELAMAFSSTSLFSAFSPKSLQVDSSIVQQSQIVNMNSRIALRTARIVRVPVRHSARRFASTNQQAAAAGGSSGLVGGLAGGAIVFGVSSLRRTPNQAHIIQAGYGYYYYSGARSIVNAASSTKSQFSKLTQNIQESAPEPNEALKWLRSTANSYAAFIPGAKSYVDAAFNDLDKVQANHGKEVEDIVNNAYKELKDATKSGMSVETATKTWEILEKSIKQLGELASDSASEILDNHPQVKEMVGGNLDQLKSMADNYGPEAKKQLEETYQQISDVIKGGVSMQSINKVRQLVQEKSDQMRKFGDEAWKKGMEQAKPYLDKNPQVKEIVEKNQESLRNGNFGELFEKIKEAVSSGSTDQLQQYVKQAGEQYSKMMPNSGGIFDTMQKLQDIAKDHGKEAEEIVKGTYEDIRKILQKRIGEAEKVAAKAGKNAKQ